MPERGETTLVDSMFKRTPEPVFLVKTNRLVEGAKQYNRAILENAGATPDAMRKVDTGIENRYKPYVVESEVIAEQLESPAYKQHVADIQNFLGVKPGVAFCPDGRIVAGSLVDARVALINRRLQGMPETRISTFDGSEVVADRAISASINNNIQQARLKNARTPGKENETPELVEFIGPHIDSHDPEHGCGAAAGKYEDMSMGGIDQFFDELGDGFNATDNNARRAGCKGTTFDTTHDAFSQGYIFGLRYAHQQRLLNYDMPLRNNIKDLHQNKKILATEFLDDELQPLAELKQAFAGQANLEIRNPENFAENMILIGTIAKEFTQKYETQEEKGFEEGFAWIPEHLREGKTEKAVRTLAYHAIRNSVYRIMSGIEPGKHDLMEHPEQLIRVGPIGAAFNVKTVPFIEVTPSGELRKQDIEGAKALYGLAERFLPKQGVDLDKEARIITVTGEYDAGIYKDEVAATTKLNEVASEVRENAGILRGELWDDVVEGKVVVIAALHKSGSREMTHVLTSSGYVE